MTSEGTSKKGGSPADEKVSPAYKVLDSLADAYARGGVGTASIVDGWLKGPAAARLPSTRATGVNDNDDMNSLARPARLGIGARPQLQKNPGHESVFASYKLKQQLTEQGQSEKTTDARKNASFSKRGAALLPMHPSSIKSNQSKNSDDEESRAKSLGNKRPMILTNPQGSKRKASGKRS